METHWTFSVYDEQFKRRFLRQIRRHHPPHYQAVDSTWLHHWSYLLSSDRYDPVRVRLIDVHLFRVFKFE